MTAYLKKNPPLYVWLIAIAFSTSIIAGADFILGEPVLKYLNADRLNAVDTSKSVKRVVIIGTSIVRRAVYFDEVMDSLAVSNQKSEYRFNRFVLGSVNLYYFYPLFEIILEAEPDIIIFQNSLIIYDKENTNQGFDSRKKFCKEWIGNSFGIDDYNLYYFFNRKPNELLTSEQIKLFQIKTRTPDRLERILINKKKFFIREIEAIPPELENLLITANVKGIRLIGMDIPRSPDVRSYMPASKDLKINLQEQYQNKYGITFWECPFDLDMDSYLDYNHVTPAVQEEYSKWLISKIKNMDE